MTEQVKATEKLRHSDERFRAAVQAIGVLWTNDVDGRMVGAQPGWAGLTGQTEAEYQGFGWASAVHPDDAQPTVDAWLQAVAERRTFVFEHRVRRHDGEWRKFAIRAVPLLEPDGTLREWVGVHIDITEALQAADALRAADRRKDEFLATLAHELRNPLAPIRTAAALLSQPDLPSEKIAWLSDVISRQTGVLSRLLDDLLDTSRITSGRLKLRKERVAVDTLIQSAVESVRHLIDAKRHSLQVSLPGSPLVLEADPLRVLQILNNLLTNAAKYTDPGGTIRVQVTPVDQQIHIDVVDSGVGIAPESLPAVFEMFGQVFGSVDRSEGGVGIGLALTKNLVEMHGGSIRAFSAGLGQGSTFHLTLPALTPATAQTDR
jgi:PAS domain S-box-containing protein